MGTTAFDPSKFTAPKAKPLPVILLLDVSGSMQGEKIHALNESVRDMLETFSDTSTSETEIWVSIITFGEDVRLNQALVSAGIVQWRDLSAGGSTPLGTALKMAKAILEDKDVVPSRAYRPAVVLVSDGAPTDRWEAPLEAFIGEGRSSKCDRLAMAIGADARAEVLEKFIEGTEHHLFYSENARQMRDFFKFVTMSVTTRTRSQTPNTIPAASAIEVKPATITQRKSKPAATAAESDDGGYW